MPVCWVSVTFCYLPKFECPYHHKSHTLPSLNWSKYFLVLLLCFNTNSLCCFCFVFFFLWWFFFSFTRVFYKKEKMKMFVCCIFVIAYDWLPIRLIFAFALCVTLRESNGLTVCRWTHESRSPWSTNISSKVTCENFSPSPPKEWYKDLFIKDLGAVDNAFINVNE